MNVLICRLNPSMASDVSKNLTAQGHNVHVIDHGQLEEYEASGAFKSCHLWPWVDQPVNDMYRKFRDVVSVHKIDLVLLCQKLFLYSNIAENVCKELGIRIIYTERFFDDKLIFDDI